MLISIQARSVAVNDDAAAGVDVLVDGLLVAQPPTHIMPMMPNPTKMRMH
jgi:hypothetical protein